MENKDKNNLPTNDNKDTDKNTDQKEGEKQESSSSDKETVLVDKEKFDAILNRLESLENETGVLRQAADVGRLQRIEDKKNTIGPARFKVSTHNGKIILSTRTVKDSVQRNLLSGITTEHQEYEILMEGGSKENVIGYDKFMDLLYANQIIGELVAEKKSGSNITLTLRLENGREIEIDSKFVN